MLRQISSTLARLRLLCGLLLFALLLQTPTAPTKAHSATVAQAITSVTVTAININNWRFGGTQASLRAYASELFFIGGVPQIAGAPGSGKWFKQIDCTVSGTTLSIPSFTLPVTISSPDNPHAKFTFVFVDSKGTERGIYLSEIAVPDTYGPVVTWEQLRQYNVKRTPRRADSEVYNKDQVNAVYAQSVAPDASASVKGKTKLSTTPTDPANPIAVGDNDARLNPNRFHALSFDGSPQTVDFGKFWDENTADLGNCFYEFWVKPGVNASSRYIVSDGYGGGHAMLFGLFGDGAGGYVFTGNVWNGTTAIPFGSNEGPYTNEWAHAAVGISDGNIVTYYNGVPVSRKAFTGPRKTPGPAGGAGRFYLGGSDHQNFIGLISQLRVFEGGNNPRAQVVGNGANLSAFTPQTTFGCDGCQLMANFFRPEAMIPDISQGYPTGTLHPGRIRGSGYLVTTDRSTYPGPQFIAVDGDTAVPNSLASTTPAIPNVRPMTPAAVPSGAIVFDSFNRANSTHAFDHIGGLGSTEGGSAGSLAWQYTYNPPTGVKSFGILQGRAVRLTNSELGSGAWVVTGNANNDIRVSRNPTITGNGAGILGGLMFRVQDSSNYWYAYIAGAPPAISAQAIDGTTPLYLYVGNTTDGNISNGTISVPTGWTTLRVVTKSDGTISVYADATLLYSTTNARFASAQGAGIYSHYVGHGLAYRWDDFTVFAAP